MAKPKPTKLFKFLKNANQTIGIYTPKSCGNRSFNSKNVLIIVFLVQLGTFVGIFFLFEAQKLDEYCISFFSMLSAIAAVFYYATNIHQNGNTTGLIEKFEELIAKSKF